ncbi:MAG: hypothetical protein AzoDbin1_04000 [Azoarcus sp.]|nr:hypothetical protein [Azoarcus sp.]
MSYGEATAYIWGIGPAAEQNLLVGVSKHYHVLKDGTIRWQKSPLNPRLPGKRYLRRMVLFDCGTGDFYGECCADDEPKDIIGFLARAWIAKPDHPMKGVPGTLHVPRAVQADPEYAAQLHCLQSIVSFMIDEIPSGFAAGVHVTKLFEGAIDDLMASAYSHDMTATLEMAQACSALITGRLTRSNRYRIDDPWAKVTPPSAAFIEAIDQLYEPRGGWRAEPFGMIVEGAPRADRKKAKP